MTQRPSSMRGFDVLIVLVVLIVAGALMYSFLPDITHPGQAVVPPLPASASDPTQSFLTLFIIATAVGAPVTGAVVLAFLFYKASKNVPIETLLTPTLGSSKTTAKPASGSKELSPREAAFWKIAATLLILGVLAVAGLAMWPWLVQLFS